MKQNLRFSPHPATLGGRPSRWYLDIGDVNYRTVEAPDLVTELYRKTIGRLPIYDEKCIVPAGQDPPKLNYSGGRAVLHFNTHATKLVGNDTLSMPEFTVSFSFFRTTFIDPDNDMTLLFIGSPTPENSFQIYIDNADYKLKTFRYDDVTGIFDPLDSSVIISENTDFVVVYRHKSGGARNIWVNGSKAAEDLATSVDVLQGGVLCLGNHMLENRSGDSLFFRNFLVFDRYVEDYQVNLLNQMYNSLLI